MRYFLFSFFFTYSAYTYADVVYHIGEDSYSISQQGIRVNQGHTDEWAYSHSLNLLAGGTSSVREAIWIQDSDGQDCVAVRYISSQFQVFGITRTKSIRLVNFCPTYIALARDFGLAPVLIPLSKTHKVKIQSAEALTVEGLIYFLGALGKNYSVKSNNQSNSDWKVK